MWLPTPVLLCSASLASNMVGIVPKKEARGLDFCGTNDHFYIVRSDINCYMKSTNFNHGSDLEVYSLHLSCRGSDHYLAHEDGLFYIIKGTYYCRVSNMHMDSGAVVYKRHPNCQGRDHYRSAFGKYYIVFQERGLYRVVSNMNTDEDAMEYTLHPSCKDGLHYWGVKDCYYFVKPYGEWGMEYYKCTDFHQNLDGETVSFHKDVISFLPGGFSITKGLAYGTWECIKSMSNHSESTIVWAHKITRKVGCTRQSMSSIEHNWNVSMGASYKSGDLTSAFAKMQFSLSASYGGKNVKTEIENWSEVTEIEESISVTLKPEEKMYIWQHTLGLGTEDLLFCCDMKFDDNSSSATEILLPPVIS